MTGSKDQRMRAGVVLTACAVLILMSASSGAWVYYATQPVLVISNWETGQVYVSEPVSQGDPLYFGWTHSQEKIPWDEYYHVGEDLTLILDTISFPAFGAGIPENKGNVCTIEDGMIVMSEIGQVFPEFVWINSHSAVREIRVRNNLLTRGNALPHHVRLRLKVERRVFYDG